jgi:hypothetical protein
MPHGSGSQTMQWRGASETPLSLFHDYAQPQPSHSHVSQVQDSPLQSEQRRSSQPQPLVAVPFAGERPERQSAAATGAAAAERASSFRQPHSPQLHVSGAPQEHVSPSQSGHRQSLQRQAESGDLGAAPEPPKAQA